MRFIRLACLTATAIGYGVACGPMSTDCNEHKTCPHPDNTGGNSSGGVSTCSVSSGGGISGTGGVAPTGGSGGVSGQSGSGGGGGAATGGAQADADAGPTCDETSTPDVEGCLVDNRYAVFV